MKLTPSSACLKLTTPVMFGGRAAIGPAETKGPESGIVDTRMGGRGARGSPSETIGRSSVAWPRGRVSVGGAAGEIPLRWSAHRDHW